MGCMRLGEWPQAVRAARAIEEKYCVDHAVDSEALITMAEPVKRLDMRGPIKLWNCWKSEWMQLDNNRGRCTG